MTKNVPHKTFVAEPADPYDSAAWLAFYDAHPGFRRSVGAAGVNDDGDDDDKSDDENEDEDEDEDGSGGENDDKSKKGDDDKSKRGDKNDGPSQREADLLKESMKRKQRIKELEAELKNFADVDPAAYREMLENKKKAEQKRLTDAGEFDKVKAQIIDAHEKAIGEKDRRIQELEAALDSHKSQIDQLTVGASFDQSKFITEKTVLTPRKARQLYGAHFDIEDGAVVPYDKPRGETGRTPLVDGAGLPLAFEAAMQKIIEIDPDKDALLRATLKPGADSDPSKSREKKNEPKMTSLEKISGGVSDLLKTQDTGPKL